MTKRARRQRAPAPPPPPKPPARPTALWALLALAVVATLAGTYYLWPTPPIGETAAADSAEPSLVTRVESLYNDIYLYRQDNGFYLLTFGAQRMRFVESVINPEDELDLPVTYTQSMTAGLAYAGKLERAMIVGLGGGRTAWYHHKSVPDMNFTAVELDPEVAKLADRYLKVRPEPNFDIVIRDGRVWLTRNEEKFDVILIDAYRGRFVPFHLLTTEFYKLVADHLAPGGVAVQNVEPSTMLFDSAVATIKAAFEHVVFFRGAGNIVMLAYNGPERDEAELQRMAVERTSRYGLRYGLTDILTRRYVPTWDEKTQPLTDDFAPVEYLKAIERHNERKS